MVAAAVDTFGGLDCAINNAVHAIRRTPLAEISEEDWDRTMAVNFRGVFLCMKYEILAMLKRGGGAIVNIGSGNEHSAARGLSWYLGAKQGIYGMTKVAVWLCTDAASYVLGHTLSGDGGAVLGQT